MQDPIRRAHLTGSSAPTPPVTTYPAPPDIQAVARRFWLPVWRLADGQVWTQRVLQYPVCLIVVADSYARFYGPSTSVSTVELSGTGWAAGVMLQPAAGRLILDAPVERITDRHVDLAALTTLDGTALRERVRRTMDLDPTSPDTHRAVIATYAAALQRFLPIDAEGALMNRLVDAVETDSSITRVSQLASLAAVSERTLGRVCRNRLGVTPKWLIQRRRLHDAVEGLKDGATSALRLTDLAADLGYTDQAHFGRDFKRVTGLTPGEYLADQRAD
ncbi:helix-turn-helix domain-containing protein [Euzebya tangerina]|uniref:helix-turn-helix domain-containing protein n=1 Tax=Euzebya tangerina TaxID=591198 RepID=UPI000E319996|nr:helix-turn-helix domain-containing protein [Euzebya tangerina]